MEGRCDSDYRDIGGESQQGGAQNLDVRQGEQGEDVGSSLTALEHYGVMADKPSLVEALHHENPAVRWLAASRLAEEGARDVAPAVVSAMLAETDLITKAKLAFAAARLGDARGITSLRSLCKTTNETSAVKLHAAENLLWLKNEDCLDQVLDLPQAEPDYMEAAVLDLLPRFQRMSIKQAERMTQFARLSLADDDPSVRMSASVALSEMGDVTSIPDLRAAIAGEQDEMVRKELERNLEKLISVKKR